MRRDACNGHAETGSTLVVSAAGRPDGGELRSGSAGDAGRHGLKVTLDVVVAVILLIVLTPVMLLVAACVVLESRGPVFYRATRVGYRGRELRMFKFRKMRTDLSGLALTVARDQRLTRVGAVLARTKLDEIPQLLNVVRREMSLIGPRPEDPRFVAYFPEAFEEILMVRPGITGLSQLAFAEESRVLDQADPHSHYVETILPQKLQLDRLYARRVCLGRDAKILFWTVVAVVWRQQVAVNRASGQMRLRRRPVANAPLPAFAGEGAGASTSGWPPLLATDGPIVSTPLSPEGTHLPSSVAVPGLLDSPTLQGGEPSWGRTPAINDPPDVRPVSPGVTSPSGAAEWSPPVDSTAVGRLGP